jgi:hypothetical protein
MKLLLDGKQRSIYFLKDNTAYYKSGGSKTDITHMFKKNGGGLKKKYSNLLIENDNNILNKNNRKLILGGTLSIIDPFVDIKINNIDVKVFCKNMLRIFLLAKIQLDIGLINVTRTKFIGLLRNIANMYLPVKTENSPAEIENSTTEIKKIPYKEISYKLDHIDTTQESDLVDEFRLLTSYVQVFLKDFKNNT